MTRPADTTSLVRRHLAVLAVLASIALVVSWTAVAPYAYTALVGCAVALPLRLRGRPALRATAPDAAPLPPVQQQPSGGPGAESAITEYGERLARQPVDADGPAAERHDWRAALDAYDDAKRAEPGRVLQILAGGHTALDRLALAADRRRRRAEAQAGAEAAARTAAPAEAPPPPRYGPPPVDPALWSHGSGPTTFRLPKTHGWKGSYLLAFEGDSPDGFLVHARTGTARRPQSVQLAYREAGPGAVRVPVSTSADNALTLDIVTEGPWRAALLSADAARILHGAVFGSSSEVLLNRFGHHSAVFEHHGDGPFVLREPRASDVTTGRIVAEGRGTAQLRLGLSDVQTLYVTSDGEWTLTTP
ncbi:hypothetical protein [Streptomyces sp. bgisy060]|uniref:hypothetical protein n=1 Tax=Streptomyces sp. bgisy060 TaxID=3413775 RepID=UPI003EBFAF4C